MGRTRILKPTLSSGKIDIMARSISPFLKHEKKRKKGSSD
jgi:hypothetical protein